MNYGYLTARVPLPYNYNVFGVLDSDFDSAGNVLVMETQARRAASVLAGYVHMASVVAKEEFPPHYHHAHPKKPLCMNQYRWLYSSRKPGDQMDSLEMIDLAKTRHAVVMCQGAFYSLDFGDQTPAALQKALEQIMIDAATSPAPFQEMIGIFTAGDRSKWAAARSLLTAMSPINRSTLDCIDAALCVLCLDPFPYTDPSRALRHAAGSPETMQNRWFDKSIQLLIASNGVAGFNCEHTGADAVVMGSFMDLMMDLKAQGKLVFSGKPEASAWKRLMWEVPNDFRARFVDPISLEVVKHLNCHTTTYFVFDDFGRSEIRKVLNTNPDAFFQVALQIAWFRESGQVSPTYETGMTRQFLHGRTDTIRVLTSELTSFVHAFDDATKSDEEKQSLFKTAVQRHIELSNEANNAEGCDRHLLGLKLIALEGGMKMHPIFADPIYQKSSTWILSTSSMPGVWFCGGFGHPQLTGYGVCYYLRSHHIRATISCMTTGTSHLGEFSQKLAKALRDLAAFCRNQSVIRQSSL